MASFSIKLATNPATDLWQALMRAPKRKRPRKREIHVPPNTDIDSLAARVVYAGSPEHKDFRSFAGQPKPRADASLCPRWINDRNMVCRWLRAAIRKGAVGAPWEGGFPRYVWHKENGVVFEGRLTNRGSGHYKGYPLNLDEWPTGIEELHD